jgi:LPS sulfotransferase NodH
VKICLSADVKELCTMTIPPKQSYIIWFSQRVGSTVLTQTLEDTGIAGRPREWFNDETGAGLFVKYRVTNAFELREILWRNGTTANGVFGVKYGMQAEAHRELTSLFAGVMSDEPRRDGAREWDAFFPQCKHVFMTRRNKLRLAVSWWRAIKSGEWHRPSRAEPTVVDGPSGRVPRELPSADLVDLYNYNAIEHLMIDADLREADMQEQFDRWRLLPYTIVYEDLIARYEPTVRDLLEFLEIPGREDTAIPAPAFAQMADDISDAWCQRYRLERAAKAK